MRKVVKKLNNGWRIKVGMFYLRWFNGDHDIIGFRFMVSPTTDRWIKILGFNQRIWGV